MELGTVIRRHREIKHLSQQEVADAIGVCQSTFCNWECDRSTPKSCYFPKLIKLLSINPAELIPDVFRANDENLETYTLSQELHQYKLLVCLLERDIELYQQRIKYLESINQL